MGYTDNQRFKELLHGYLHQSLTGNELAEFFRLIPQPGIELLLREELDVDFKQGVPDLTGSEQNEEAFKKLAAAIGFNISGLEPFQRPEQSSGVENPSEFEHAGASSDTPVHRIHFLRTAWFRYAAAVILLLGIGWGAYLLNTEKSSDRQAKTTVEPTIQPEIMPGSDKAILTLSNGKRVVLNQAGSEIITDGELTINNENGELTYGKSDIVVYNTMSTPNGAQYKLVLPDGSRVWLNASSSITYPTAFSGNARAVSITGEAYFEVSKDKNKPFHVKVNDVEVEVLGTHFNINSYSDEAAIKTTLLEGTVKVNTVILKPGEQAQFSSDKIRIVNEVDLEEVMAWKNGKFLFSEKTDIETIMRQISRWYDVEIEYRGKVTQHFWGSISRSANALQVLKLLETTGGVKFKIEGRKVIVIP